MKPHVAAHLRNAHERLKDAEAALSAGRYAATADRTYYVMFEAASAMLASLGLEFDSHYGLKNKFGELLVKAGKVDRKFADNLSRAFELREDAVYALDSRAEIPRDVAEEQLRKARKFLAMAEQFLGGAGGDCE